MIPTIFQLESKVYSKLKMVEELITSMEEFHILTEEEDFQEVQEHQAVMAEELIVGVLVVIKVEAGVQE